MNITLLSSFHQELGNCNADELYKIIESLKPDVIFEELPLEIFNTVYKKNYIPASLEAKAIKRYVDNYEIEHFPVDTYCFSYSELFSEFDFIANNSQEYLKLFSYQIALIKKYGFQIINSHKFLALIENLQNLEKEVLLKCERNDLLEKYMIEREIHHKRELVMLNNIYKYCSENQFNKALFICGVEHRKPLSEKIKLVKNQFEVSINWQFYHD